MFLIVLTTDGTLAIMESFARLIIIFCINVSECEEKMLGDTHKWRCTLFRSPDLHFYLLPLKCQNYSQQNGSFTSYIVNSYMELLYNYLSWEDAHISKAISI